MNRLTMLAILAAAVLVCFALDGFSQTPHDTPVISLSDVVDYTGKSLSEVLALRPQIVTQLVRDYDCIVLSRSNPGSLEIESTIARFGALSTPGPKHYGIWAADFAVRVHLKPTTKLGAVTAYIFIQDIRENNDKSFEKLSIEADKFSQVVDEVVSRLASALALKKAPERKHASPAKQTMPGETWAVLPFAYLNRATPQPDPYQVRLIELTFSAYPPMEQEHYTAISEWSGWTNNLIRKRQDLQKRWEELIELKSRGKSHGLQVQVDAGGVSLAVESVLQQEPSGIKLVDRQSLQAVFDELTLNSMVGMTEAFGGWVGSLVGADRIVMGYVMKDGNKYKVLIHLVDAKTSMIVGVREVTCQKEQDVPLISAKATLELANEGAIRLQPRVPNAWQRRREADFYLLNQRQLAYASRGDPGWFNRIEIGYLLMNDDPEYLEAKIGPPLQDTAISNVVGFPRPGNINATLMFENIMTRYGDRMKCGPQLLERAYALINCCEYEMAKSRIEDYLKQTANPDVRRARLLQACAEHGLGNETRALTLARQAAPMGETFQLILKIARSEGMQDRRLEYETLKRMYAENSGLYLDEQFDLLRLTLKYDGPEKTIRIWESMTPEEWTRSGEIGGAPRHAVVAECYMQLGKYEKVRTLCGKKAEWYPWAKSQLEKVDSITGQKTPVGIVRKTGVDICPFPSRYKIYCFPVQNCNTAIVAGVCSRVGKWFGTQVVVKDVVPSPSGTLNQETEIHDLPSFSRQLLANANIPDDAVLVFFVTAEAVEKWHYHDVCGECHEAVPWNGNPLVVSHFYCSNPAVIADDLISMMGWCVVHPPSEDWLGWPRLPRTDCYRRTPLSVSLVDQDKDLCPECAKKYNEAGFDACHKALQTFQKWDNKRLSVYPYTMELCWWKENEEGRQIARSEKSGVVRGSELDAANTVALDSMVNARIQTTLEKAKAGDAYHQSLLASWYASGLDGLKFNHNEAFKWAKMAADQGYPSGVYQLAYRYWEGKGVVGDARKADALFKTAIPGLTQLAERGDGEAQCNLGLMYWMGMGTQKNVDQGVEWNKRAAAQDFPRGLFNYAVALRDGSGVGKDAVEAVRLLQRAADKGFVRALVGLADMYCDGKGCAKDPLKALELCAKAAKFGNGEAQNLTGYCCMNGIGVKRDFTEAERWLRMAILNGCDRAIRNLGLLYAIRDAEDEKGEDSGHGGQPTK